MRACSPALVILCFLSLGAVAKAATVLRAAEVRVVMTSPTTCEVWVRLTVQGGREIDHRIEAFDGSHIELVGVQSATRVGDVRTIGRTLSLLLDTADSPYELRYRVQQAPARRDRCPVWLPAVATDGQSRAVHVQVELPPGAVAGHSMPALNWTGSSGSTSLRHLPAFVRIPYAPAGESPAWDIARAMDVVALVVFGAATAMWIRSRKR
jgi:hypothetical protein